jgi:hypothetical protein
MVKKCILLFSVIILLFSCNKEVTSVDGGVTSNLVGSISIYDGKWVVRDAKMYLLNEQNGDKIFYDHFSSTKTSSSLRISGSILDIETIVKDSTTWEFFKGYNGIGTFVLNSDYSNEYGFQQSGNSYFRIIENPQNNPNGSENDLNGSSVPFTPKYLGNNKIEIRLYYVHEGVNFILPDGSTNNAPTYYFTKIIMEKI